MQIWTDIWNYENLDKFQTMDSLHIEDMDAYYTMQDINEVGMIH